MPLYPNILRFVAAQPEHRRCLAPLCNVSRIGLPLAVSNRGPLPGPDAAEAEKIVAQLCGGDGRGAVPVAVAR